MKVTITTDDERKIEIFRKRVKEVNFDIKAPYVDETKSILVELLLPNFKVEADIELDDGEDNGDGITIKIDEDGFPLFASSSSGDVDSVPDEFEVELADNVSYSIKVKVVLGQQGIYNYKLEQ